MNYSSVREISSRWGISARRVLALCNGGRIPGAVKAEGRWYIPAASPKPPDGRRRNDEASPQLADASLQSPISQGLLPGIAAEDPKGRSTLLVGELFSLKYFQDWRILGGEQGLDRPITSLNLMESPDIANWAKRNQFIVTTGYCIRDDVNVQKQVMLDLSSKKCAGLGIKIMRFFRTIPQHMIDLADQYGMPLIEIPGDYNVSEIMNEIMKGVYVKKLEATETAYALYQDFSKAAFGENEMDGIAGVLGRLLRMDVTLSDGNWSLLGSYADPQSDFKIPALVAAETPVQLSPDREAQPLSQPVRVDGKPLWRNILAIGEPENITGYLTIWGGRDTFSEREQLAISQAAAIAGFAVGRHRQSLDRAESQREAYLRDLLQGRIQSRDVALQRGAVLGLNPGCRFLCAAAETGAFDEQDAGLSAKALVTFREIFRREAINGYALPLEGHVAMILPLDREKTWWNGNSTEGDPLYRLTTSLLASGVNTILGVGLPAELPQLRASYLQAREAVGLRKKQQTSWQGRIQYYSHVRVEAALITLSPDKQVELKEQIVARLEVYDATHNAQLVETLQAFFACKCNLSETARQLYIHRNTLTYRMERASDLLELDLENTDDLLMLQLALRLYPYQC